MEKMCGSFVSAKMCGPFLHVRGSLSTHVLCSLSSEWYCKMSGIVSRAYKQLLKLRNER